MARIRYVKPEFFEDTEIAELSIESRLLYIGLWTLMDRQGVYDFDPRLIKKNVFPYDDKFTAVRVSNLLAELIDRRFLTLIEHDAKHYLYCPTFSKHQKFHREEKIKYLLPKELFLNAPLAPCQHHSSTMPTLTNAGASSTGTGTGTGTGNGQPETPPGGLHWLARLWNEECGALRKCEGVSEARMRKIRSRLKEKKDPDFWRAVVRRIAASAFCGGKNDRGWRADFDFLLKPDTAERVLEGKYDDRIGTAKQALSPFQAELVRELDAKAGGVA